MIHVKRLADRILFLNGDVELKASHEVQKVTDVKDMQQMSRSLEEQSALDYNRWANECSTNADSVSIKLFEDLVVDEERHYDKYDNEIDNLDRFGMKYLALQSIQCGKTRRTIVGPGA
jgi:bacterioferritin